MNLIDTIARRPTTPAAATARNNPLTCEPDEFVAALAIMISLARRRRARDYK